MNWAETVKLYRQQNGLLQKQLAFEFGVDVMTVSRWERGISEPTRLQKARLKDLLSKKKDPLNLPFIQNLTYFNDGTSIVDMRSFKYCHFSNHSHMSRLSPKDALGREPMQFVQTPAVLEAYERVGGFGGMLKDGLINFRYVVDLGLAECDQNIEIMGSILTFEGYDPTMVVQRKRTHQPMTEHYSDVDIVYADDLPAA